ncbi:MAG TPA: hypothetical protein VK444_02345 [Methanobacteriaceae archaeon]|nr:hypothetical protein [Methanobacteriaceae archaeon]
MKGAVIAGIVFVILIAMVGYSYITVSNGPIEPLGRIAFVKFLNPDFYPGHPHSQLLAKFAEERGSKCALVVHFGGSSNYRSYQEGNVYLIELAFIDTQGTGAVGPTNYLDSLKIALFGVPEGRYKYKSDGIVFNTYDEAMAHVYKQAQQHGQTGPLPMAWHGNARKGSPIFAQGCGFPLYFQILLKTYGIIPAYVYTVYGMIFPYLNNPYAHYELSNYQQLQVLYKDGDLNYS